MYWIGGSGNWNDIQHWGQFSGAPVSGGNNYNDVPTAGDTVIFDNGSGFVETNRTVTLNIAGVCHDMFWQGTDVSPIFTLNDDLSIAGSLVLQAGMTISAATTRNIYFGSTAIEEDLDYTITSNNGDAKYRLYTLYFHRLLFVPRSFTMTLFVNSTLTVHYRRPKTGKQNLVKTG
jgi:hypothetical protein